MPTTGRGSSSICRACTAPTTAPAACASAERHSRFSPYSPPAHSRIIRSGGMRSAGIRCEYAMVDSTTFGTPSGSAFATSSARSVPIVPPSASRPSKRRCAWSCVASIDAPCAIRVIAVFSSPLSMICASVTPAAAATCAFVMSGWTPPRPSTPTSITSGRAPSCTSRSQRKPISSLLVSTVPISRMTGTSGGASAGRLSALTGSPPPPRTRRRGCPPASRSPRG